MRRLSSILLATVIVLSVAAAPLTATASAAQSDECTFPVSETDVTGTEVQLEERPDRVVALQPSDAQTTWEIGARDQVVGLPQNSNTAYLNDTGDRTNVANDDGTTDVESVVGANPDLALAANVTTQDTVQQLRSAGLTVYHFGLAENLSDIYGQIETTGRLTGNCEAANESVADMQDRVSDVRDAAADRDSPRVLYYFFEYTTGTGTHIHDLIETAGGENVAAEAGLEGYQPISAEIVADRDPQVIVDPSDATPPSGAPYNGTTAAQNDQIVSVNANYVSQPGPRVVIALESMAEAFAEFEAQTETTTPETTTESATPDTVTESATPDVVTESATDGSGPGFGLVGGAVALVATLVAARRKGT
jgi:iron complex transport system substrate-binding protein